MKSFEKYESEVRSYCRSYPTVFNKAKNEFMVNEEGEKYIDFFCGAGSVNYGHNNDYIKAKILDYIMDDGIMHSLDMYTSAKRDFIDFFEEKVLIPRDLDYKLQFVGPTGANAVEAAVKLARKVTGRTEIFALMGAFHGMTLGSLALTSDRDGRAAAGVPLNNVTHIPAPYMFPELDTIKYIETLLSDDHSGVAKPAAIVIETIQTDGGVYPLEVEYLQKLSKLCKDNEILLIVDDIQCGCARSGWFFSFERAGIKPDMVTVAKSIGAYGFPFSLVLLKPEIDKWAPAEHTGTFRGNQIAIVAAKAGLEFMLEKEIEKETKRKGEIVKNFMEKEIKPLHEKIQTRGIGLLWGIDFNEVGEISKDLVAKCFENKLIAERAGRNNNVLKIMPALTISDESLLNGLNIIKNSILELLYPEKIITNMMFSNLENKATAK
ncbi:MAG: aspartate aminotransferase family protein [Clostridia bacterium]